MIGQTISHYLTSGTLVRAHFFVFQTFSRSVHRWQKRNRSY